MSEQPNNQDQKRQLSDQELLFVAHYMTELNGSKAARKAGYSAKTAGQIAYELLKKPEIRAEIDARMAEIMPKPEVLKILAEHARGNLNDFFFIGEEQVEIKKVIRLIGESEDGEGELEEVYTETVIRPAVYVDLRKAKKDGKLHLLKKYSEGRYGVTIELHDPQAAAIQLGKYHKLWVERSEVTGANGAPLVPEVVEKALLKAYGDQHESESGDDDSDAPAE